MGAIAMKMEKEKVSETSIGNLPIDVLSLIGSSLLARDRVCFRAVCKRWQSVIPPVPCPIHESTESLTSTVDMVRFPLLMFSRCGGSCFSFYHPICNTTYVLDSPEIANAKIRFSKDGWLLMSQGLKGIFFFNPFIKKRIDLPDLPYTYSFEAISFSSLPMSPDCIVFGEIWTFDNSASFCFICHGEDTWNECTAEHKFDFVASHNNPVFHSGMFYYMDKNGKLGTFDPNNDSNHGWTVFPKPEQVQPCNFVRKNYLVECNGELICVFEGHVGKWIRIFKLDDSAMTWSDIESLGDKMLFVSRTASFSAATKGSKQEVVGMENKIYFPRFHGKNSVFYSLKMNRFYTLGSGYNSDDFYNTTIKMDCTWNEPSFDIFPMKKSSAGGEK
ncbi:hypothetical protein LguiA_007844 [Lonicera macranthoides]